VTATGGGGGSNSNGAGGNGGNATASGTGTGTGSLTISVTANGGAGGTGSTTGGHGSAASATSAGTATTANVYASAHGGTGTLSSSGSASATATGKSGTASASADAHQSTGSLVRDVSGSTSTSLYGGGSTSSTVADTVVATIGLAAAAMDTTAQGVVHIAGKPLSADVTAILGANSNIKAAFNTAAPSYFAITELGARHSTLATGAESTSTTLNLTVDLNQLAVKEHLLIGFYGGKSFGAAGVTGVTLTISANGATLVNQSFGTAAAAVTWFTNHALDVGTLTAPAYAGGTLNLTATLTVTSNAAGSGFYGNMLIGDPPAVHHAAAAHDSAAPIADHFAGLHPDLFGAPQFTAEHWEQLLGQTAGHDGAVSEPAHEPAFLHVDPFALSLANLPVEHLFL
jgi:hypothetical protein